MTGDTVTVVWAEEYFSPQSYQGFKIGPFTLTTHVQDGETTIDAVERGHKELDKIANLIYIKKRNGFFKRLEALK